MALDPLYTITIGGVPCYDEDVDEGVSKKGGQAVRRLVCAWDSRWALATALGGGSTQAGIITTNIPAADYPDATWMKASDVRFEGVGKRKVGVNGMVGYDYARLYVTYRNPDRDLGQLQDLGALSMDISNEIISPPRDEATFKWKSDNVDVTPEATPGLSMSTATWERVRKNLASIPVPLIIALLDHVNDAPFEGAPKGQVIFKGARPSWRYTNLGNQNLDLGLTFIYRTVAWNKFLRPSTGQFEEVIYKATGQPFFPSGNLSALYA